MIGETVGIDAGNASHNLSQMADAGLIRRTVSGRYTMYEPNLEMIAVIKEFFT